MVIHKEEKWGFGKRDIYKFEHGAYAWINDVIINDIDTVIVDEEEIEIYKGDIIVANAFKNRIDECGALGYNEKGFIDNETYTIVYEY